MPRSRLGGGLALGAGVGLMVGGGLGLAYAGVAADEYGASPLPMNDLLWWTFGLGLALLVVGVSLLVARSAGPRR